METKDYGTPQITIGDTRELEYIPSKIEIYGEDINSGSCILVDEIYQTQGLIDFVLKNKSFESSSNQKLKKYKI